MPVRLTVRKPALIGKRVKCSKDLVPLFLYAVNLDIHFTPENFQLLFMRVYKFVTSIDD